MYKGRFTLTRDYVPFLRFVQIVCDNSLVFYKLYSQFSQSNEIKTNLFIIAHLHSFIYHTKRMLATTDWLSKNIQD
jgi:hypothetical protein